jgi:hypothetical protein
LVLAVHEVFCPAKLTVAATATEKSYANTLVYIPACNAVSEGVYFAHNFMARNPWPANRESAFHSCSIGVAYTTGLNSYPYISGLRRG